MSVALVGLASSITLDCSAEGACSNEPLLAALQKGDADTAVCDDAVDHLRRRASLAACTRACTPSGMETELAPGSLTEAMAELDERVNREPDLCHQGARLQMARRYACLEERAAVACVPDYAQAWQLLSPLRCVQLANAAPDSCRKEQGQFEAIRLGLVLLAALLPEVEVTVSGVAGEVEVFATDRNRSSWALERVTASASEPRRFRGALVPGAYDVRVSSIGAHAPVAARNVTVALGRCAWSVEAPSSLVIGAQRSALALPMPGPQFAEPESRSWVLPGIWLGSVAGLTVWSLFAHARASSLTSELDDCAGDILSCRFAERRREIQRWDNVHENTAYAALILGGAGLTLGGLVWLIENRAAPMSGRPSNVTVGVNHVSVTVQY